jgi:hypothetical protein
MNQITSLKRYPDVMRQLQAQFGSSDYSRWQFLRREWWSSVAYPAAGLSEINFFGDAMSGTNNRQITNMKQANSFGNTHFLLKQIECTYWSEDWSHNDHDGTDAETFWSDAVAGFTQAGVFTLTVNGSEYVNEPLPFLRMAPVSAMPHIASAGVQSLTLTEATPNTLLTNVAPSPNPLPPTGDGYAVVPNLWIQANEHFETVIGYPGGLIPIIATGINIDATNKTYLKAKFSGLEFRPQQ